jgi:hypothetical protein
MTTLGGGHGAVTLGIDFATPLQVKIIHSIHAAIFLFALTLLCTSAIAIALGPKAPREGMYEAVQAHSVVATSSNHSRRNK